MRSRGHSELTDDAAARYGVGQEWPADHGLPLSLVADPAYHLLHRAVRLLRRGDVLGADRALAEALTCLGGASHAKRPRWPALITAAGRSGQMERHHLTKLLESFKSAFPAKGWNSTCVIRAWPESPRRVPWSRRRPPTQPGTAGCRGDTRRCCKE